MSEKFKEFKDRMQEAARREFGPQIYPAWGNQNAKIVSISQAPSISVVKFQKPFFDRSGQRLRNEWYKISDEDFYNKDNFYFTVIGRGFPGKSKQGDKAPGMKWAKKWLWPEISYLNPRLFLVVGRVAADFLFPGKNFTELVFKNQKINGRMALVLPHPSPANIKWFLDHPEFDKKRLPYLREKIHQALK